MVIIYYVNFVGSIIFLLFFIYVFLLTFQRYYKFMYMDFLPKSQRSNSTWQPVSPLKATTTTCFEKNIGRETDANWANRINKDFYDLTYDVKFSQSKGKEQFKGTPSHFRMKKKLNKLNSKDQKQQQIFDKYKLRLELIAENKQSNPEQYYIMEAQKYSTVNTQGLCKFEFDKTIAGRLKNRKHLHLDFKNQTGRQWISRSLQPSLESSPMAKISKSPKLRRINQKYFRGNKCHDFDSYDKHRAFSPKQTVDNFYQTLNTFKVLRTNTIKQTVRMQGITGRIQQRPKQSSTLSYQEYSSKNKTMRSPTSHQFTRSPRNIRFERQVILSTRGCYR